MITTFCDGLPEDIENEVSGILIPKMDSKSLADAIIRIYKDHDLGQKLRDGGDKVIREKLDKTGMINGLKKLHSTLD